MEAYFAELGTPVTAPSAQPSTVATGADLKVMGGTTLLFGALMTVTGLIILVTTGGTFSFVVNCATGCGFLLFGSFVYAKGRNVSRQQHSEHT